MDGAAFFCVALVRLNLLGESCPRKEGKTPSLVNLSKTTLPKPRAESSARACFDCLALTELTRLSVPKCIQGEKLARAGG